MALRLCALPCVPAVAVLSALLAAAPPPALAQAAGAVEGRVVDAAGGALPGVRTLP